jgi:hypothetical protein
MTNVIDFPKRELDIEVSLSEFDLEQAEENFRNFEERIAALAEILDLNVQGMYHTLDADTEEMMMALLHLSALWSVRAGIMPDDYMSLVQSIHLEITDDE